MCGRTYSGLEINPLSQFRPRNRSALLGGPGNQYVGSNSGNKSGAPEAGCIASGAPQNLAAPAKTDDFPAFVNETREEAIDADAPEIPEAQEGACR